jgi:hypothetical protein
MFFKEGTYNKKTGAADYTTTNSFLHCGENEPFAQSKIR